MGVCFARRRFAGHSVFLFALCCWGAMHLNSISLFLAATWHPVLKQRSRMSRADAAASPKDESGCTAVGAPVQQATRLHDDFEASDGFSRIQERLGWLLSTSKLLSILSFIFMVRTLEPLSRLWEEDSVIDAASQHLGSCNDTGGFVPRIWTLRDDPCIKVVPDFVTAEEVQHLHKLVKDRWRPSVVDVHPPSDGGERLLLERTSFECVVQPAETHHSSY
eukprot:TRINITY_DN78950_c0_g1_i1.p1 TRINITY_DN78950_c0_g1~~TRINITY_DN78950_c0_g1_i1.p1  ORF type:complete len:220 (+),score=27.86 TRINITY_DN78950_c0_g1_i1:38-697(+)